MAEKSLSIEGLVSLAEEDLQFWHDNNGDAYCAIPVNDDFSLDYKLKSAETLNWLRKHSFEKWKQYPTKLQIQQVVESLEAQAQSGPALPTAIRVARHEKTIYIDLMRGAEGFVAITEEGWELTTDCPIRFLRKPGMKRLPLPVYTQGKSDPFWDLLNLSSDDKKLSKAFAIGALIPDIPYPVLIFTGEQGSSKSTTAKAIRYIVDPHEQLLRSFPSSERDYAIMAKNNWIVGLDNLSRLTIGQQDVLCRCSTGAGFATRKLYVDDDEIMITVQRPQIVTAIDIDLRDDLRDRSLLIEMDPLSQDKRVPERVFWEEVEKCKNITFSHLLDAVAESLKKDAVPKDTELPRMADFSINIIACESKLGWESGTFLRIYGDNRRASTEHLISGNLLAQLIRKIPSKYLPFEQTPSQLLTYLKEQAEQEQYRLPKDPRSLSIELKRLAPALRESGIDIFFSRGKERKIRVSSIERQSEKPDDDAQNQADIETAPEPGPGIIDRMSRKSSKKREKE